jgi:hypothetical protein
MILLILSPFCRISMALSKRSFDVAVRAGSAMLKRDSKDGRLVFIVAYHLARVQIANHAAHEGR